MTIVKITCGAGDPLDSLIRQLPHNLLSKKNVELVINKSVSRCDCWFILHPSSLRNSEEVLCDPRNVVLVTMEPPDWGYPKKFFDQFAHVVSCDSTISNCILTQNWSTWWVGNKVTFDSIGRHSIKCDRSVNHDFLSKLNPPPSKLDRISVITSSKSVFPGHIARLRFLEFLSTHPVSHYIDFYGGRGLPVFDKLDALLPYKYHLCLENSIVSNYWTEKLADPFLAWSLPFYSGCPNILDFFPSGSLYRLCIDDWHESADLMLRALEADVYRSATESLRKARDLVLNEYNILTLIASFAAGLPSPSSYAVCRLEPMHSFPNSPLSSLLRRAHRHLCTVMPSA